MATFYKGQGGEQSYPLSLQERREENFKKKKKTKKTQKVWTGLAKFKHGWIVLHQ